jgi:hypothetical protein
MAGMERKVARGKCLIKTPAVRDHESMHVPFVHHCIRRPSGQGRPGQPITTSLDASFSPTSLAGTPRLRLLFEMCTQAALRDTRTGLALDTFRGFDSMVVSSALRAGWM